MKRDKERSCVAEEEERENSGLRGHGGNTERKEEGAVEGKYR